MQQQRPRGLGTLFFTSLDRSQERTWLDWWYRLTCPAPASTENTPAERDKLRRSRLASIVLLGLLLVSLLGLPIGLSDQPTMITLIVTFSASILSVLLNRLGLINVAGYLLTLAITTALAIIILSEPHGQLDFYYVPIFDLFVLPLVIAAALLPPLSIFVVAAANTAFIVLDLLLQPAAPNFAFFAPHGEISSDGYGILIRPVVLQILVSIVAYLLVQSILRANQRADLALRVAELERREVERTRAMEEGIFQVLNAHVKLSNGNFQVRVPVLSDPQMWQIGNSLNTLIQRLERFAEADVRMNRTQEAAHQLAQTLLLAKNGLPFHWPAPSGTPVDELLEAIKGTPRG